MRTVLALGVLVLVFAVSAAGSTPNARILFNEAAGTSTDIITLDADATSYHNLTPGQAAFYVFDTEGSWSPDGSRIAFTSHRDSNVSNEIYVMDADGSNQTRLTHDGPDGVQNSGGGVFDISPEWAPSGGTIAYFQVAGGAYEVWTMGPDGKGQHARTKDGGTKSALAWSPDGTRLLYQSQTGIWVVGAPAGVPVKVADGLAPVWSPDSARIAYGNHDGLWTVGPDGHGAFRVASLPATTPSWSADGSLIAFAGIRYFPDQANRYGIPSRQDVFVVHPDGTGLRRLTGPAGDGYVPAPPGSGPSWWPDGSRLFFYGQPVQGAPPAIYVMNADGTCEGAFAQTGTQLIHPRWRPGSAPGLGQLHCADLRLAIVPSGGYLGPAGLGQDSPWSFTVDNDGNETATGVRVELTSTAGNLTLQGVSATCTGAKIDVLCALPPIPPGGSLSLAITVRSSIPGQYPFTVAVSAVEPDSDPSTNTVATVTSVLPCTRVGTWGDDVMYGTPGPDKICALTGRDEVYGGKGNDFLDSGNGSDIVAGGPGRDVIDAKGGNDTIYARDGERDQIDCGSERDVVIADRFDVTHLCETVVRPKR